MGLEVEMLGFGELGVDLVFGFVNLDLILDFGSWVLDATTGVVWILEFRIVRLGVGFVVGGWKIDF